LHFFLNYVIENVFVQGVCHIYKTEEVIMS